jgi:hypothetical protein
MGRASQLHKAATERHQSSGVYDAANPHFVSLESVKGGVTVGPACCSSFFLQGSASDGSSLKFHFEYYFWNWTVATATLTLGTNPNGSGFWTAGEITDELVAQATFTSYGPVTATGGLFVINTGAGTGDGIAFKRLENL